MPDINEFRILRFIGRYSLIEKMVGDKEYCLLENDTGIYNKIELPTVMDILHLRALFTEEATIKEIKWFLEKKEQCVLIKWQKINKGE